MTTSLKATNVCAIRFLNQKSNQNIEFFGRIPLDNKAFYWRRKCPLGWRSSQTIITYCPPTWPCFGVIRYHNNYCILIIGINNMRTQPYNHTQGLWQSEINSILICRHIFPPMFITQLFDSTICHFNCWRCDSYKCIRHAQYDAACALMEFTYIGIRWFVAEYIRPAAPERSKAKWSLMRLFPFANLCMTRHALKI